MTVRGRDAMLVPLQDALRDVKASRNGVKLKAGTQVEAALDDKIVFQNDTEMDLVDLRATATICRRRPAPSWQPA